ncbi:hypothetical protein GC105_02035 [Alkalibaculum sp. M08DMB]|uniref:Uncharacterized protein n=1 Tax=Alkalibaculum sporogenes TaxID=2655001 RepID=A0A6A7K562_9FIRM|nr:hypothetical protein [Alkalibaculum sporogenes]MPW24572.1 hypothetical protein [Alkalibaculum sporogenes]
MDGFITLEALTEFPVLVLLVGIITQFTKRGLDWLFSKIFNIISMPTEIISLVISVILLISISYANGALINKSTNEIFAIIMMNIVNAFIVSLAANKGYERIKSDESVIAKIQKRK